MTFKPLGSVIEFKSGDEPDNLFGASYDFAVLDEAGRLTEEAFNAVRSTVTATGGQMRLLTNPTGRTGWFFELYSRGLNSDESVQSFRWRTADNVRISSVEIDDAQRTLSEDAFRSLYLLGNFSTWADWASSRASGSARSARCGSRVRVASMSAG